LQFGERVPRPPARSQDLGLLSPLAQGLAIGVTDRALGFDDAGGGAPRYASGLDESRDGRLILALGHNLDPFVGHCCRLSKLNRILNILCKIDG
jgi:hypothetical protein